VIVVDTSAVIAMMFGEPQADFLAQRLAASPVGQRRMSVANYVEAGTVLAGRTSSPERAHKRLDAFLTLVGISLAPIDADQARIALEARVRFGKGFGAAAKLNFGDCFAYALAKTMDAPLLYIGDDFSKTDLS
jgi:ribonuclease VapC